MSLLSEHIPLEPICAYCEHYTFKTRDDGGWAFCNLYDKWFTKQLERGSTPAGERTCPKWIQKGTCKQV